VTTGQAGPSSSSGYRVWRNGPIIMGKSHGAEAPDGTEF